jgi:hypothetical protein
MKRKQCEYIAHCVQKQPFWNYKYMLSNNSFVQLPKSNMCETKNDGMTKKPINFF